MHSKIKNLIVMILLLSPISMLATEAELTNRDARIEYARLLRNLKRYDESLEQYQKLLAETPDNNIINVEMMEVLYYKGDHKAALEMIEKIPLDSLDDKTKITVAEIYQVSKNYPKAEALFRNYLAKNPNDNKIKLKLAEQLSWEKRYEESVQLFKQVVAANPSDTQLRRKYALVLMWMGNEAEAAKELEGTLNDK